MISNNPLTPGTPPVQPEGCNIPAALAFIREQATRGITVGQVFDKTQQVSRVTFHRRFRAATGKSPAQALRDRKLEEVRRLLAATDLPLAQVSELSGFSSPKVMARTFRAAEGCTPRAYRARQQPKTAPPAPAPDWAPRPQVWG